MKEKSRKQPYKSPSLTKRDSIKKVTESIAPTTAVVSNPD